MIRIESVHEMQQYMDLLSTSLEIYMDDTRLNQAFMDICYKADDLKELVLLWLRIESGGLYSFVNPDNIIDFLQRIGIDLEKRFANRRTKNISLDMKRVITPLIEAGKVPELLTAYKEYRTYRSYASTVRKLVEGKTFHDVTPSGRTLVKFPTHIEERDNLRVYYSDIAVVSVPKKYSDMITGPSDEYFIGWCDYPQADWRFAYNLFIRDSNNEQIMRQYDDAYEGLARMVEGDKFDLEAFKERRQAFKTHCLKVFYNSKDPAPIPSAIREFYRSCPKYRKLLYDVSVLYQFKLPIPCTSYFGYEQLLPEGTYPDAFISKALNTPIQTFTSHIVNETVFAVCEKFWSLGYTKRDVNVYYVRHDEPLFLFTRNVIKDAWVFEECSQIYIPGFTPIHLDFHFGTYYQEEDESLTNEIRNSISQNIGMITPLPKDPGKAKEYSPVPSVESVYAQLFGDSGNYTVQVYDYRTSNRNSFKSSQSDAKLALADVIANSILQWLGLPSYLLVRTSGFDFIEQISGTLVKVIDKYDSHAAISEGDLGG